MRYSNKKVEQIDILGQIIIDHSEILSNKELAKILIDSFQCKIETDGNAYGIYENKKYCLCFKNISYLGTPHPIYKKRIQIPPSFITTYYDNFNKGILTFFIGIYKYKENIVFVNFNTEKYIKNKAHNSSAHVLAIDLAYASVNGYHTKKDSRQNEIFCFGKNMINSFFDMYLLQKIDFTPNIFKIFNNFYDQLNYHWYGVECYEEMMAASYHRCNQPEWPGAYLEYEFESFLSHNPDVTTTVVYSPQRGGDGIDLDLYFPLLNEYGDLKAHTNTSSGIIGNKTTTIEKCIVGNNSVFYIVFNHDSTYDKNNNFTVTEYWNQALQKDNLRSYGNKMKYDITLTGYMILEINEKNYRYLKTNFQKNFKNSDGKKRTDKIIISKSMLPNFIIHEYSHKHK